MADNSGFLRESQLEAVDKMKNGCILNGGVGSGKSRTALYYYYTVVCGGVIGKKLTKAQRRPLVIITTAMKRDKREWQAEMVPFCLNDSKVIVDSWNNIQKYAKFDGCFFIFDEDRVTGSGKWVKSFLKIARRNKWIILSATPGDTWEQYIPVFIANGFYKNRTEFLEEHAVYSKYCTYPKIDKWIGVGKLIRYRNSILVPMDVERHTERHDIVLKCGYDMKKYKDVMKTRWDIYKCEPIRQASGLCYVLRRLVNEDDSRSVKVLELCESIDKVIIFYNFDYELEILKNLGYRKGTKVAEWNGHNHEPIPKSSKWVYLVQYTAGCEGWNCIETNSVIFYSQTYSFKVLEQARGRIDRLNTCWRDLYYYHLTSDSKIDIAIKMALTEKKRFNENKFYERVFG